MPNKISMREFRNACSVLGCAFILICSLLPMLCAAGDVEQRALVNKLKAEPMSLFDWGLYSLEEELQSVKRNERDYIRAYYDIAKNRIFIEGVFFVDAKEIKAINARRACYTRHHAIKLTLGIIDTDRINLAPAAEFRLGSKFSHTDHEGDTAQPNADAIGKQLMEVAYIKVGIGSNVDQFPFVQDMRCAGDALSQEVTYSDGTVDQRSE